MEKEFTTNLILNYRTGQFRVIKSEKTLKNIKPIEIPIKVSLKVKFPEQKILEAKGDIELGETKASEITLELIEPTGEENEK